MGDEVVESVVLFRGDILFVFHPDRLHGIEVLAVEINGEADEIAVLFHDVTHAVFLGEVRGIFLEMNDDRGAARGVIRSILQRIAILTVTYPAHGSGFRLPRARANFHHVCRHEDTVKSHTKLSDEILWPALSIFGHFQELLGAGVGDGAEEFHDLLTGHSNAGICNCQRTFLLICSDAQTKLALGLVDGWLRQLFETQFFASVRSITYQLAYEDLSITVKCVNDNV